MSNDQIKLTSNDPVFDDIRPCRDDEVQSELNKIVSDDLVLNSILKFRYPVAYKPFSFILKPLVMIHQHQYQNSIVNLDIAHNLTK